MAKLLEEKRTAAAVHLSENDQRLIMNWKVVNFVEYQITGLAVVP